MVSCSPVLITSILLDYVETGKLQSLDAEPVKPFLVDGLKWRVISVRRPPNLDALDWLTYLFTRRMPEWKTRAICQRKRISRSV